MSSITLKHSGGNSVSIAAPSSNPASNRTITLPSTDSGTLLTTTNPKPGNVIQVAQLNLGGGFSTTSTSFTDVSGFTLDITTTGSNKVLVEVQAFVSNTGEHYYTFLKLLRGSTSLQRCVRMQDSDGGNSGGLVTMTVLDSPGAGTHTYKVQFATEHVNKTAKIGLGGSAGSHDAALPDSIIRLLEIAV